MHTPRGLRLSLQRSEARAPRQALTEVAEEIAGISRTHLRAELRKPGS